MAALRQKTEQRTNQLRSLKYEVKEMWEHQFVKEKKDNDELKKFLETHETEDRLDPRDAFYGGRTNALQLHYEGTAKYVDFTSLYPWVSV